MSNTKTINTITPADIAVEIQKTLDVYLERMREIAREEREYHEARIAGALDNVGDHLFSLSLKLDAVEKMQSRQASQLDHGSAFARHSSARLDKHLAELGMVAEKIQEQIETVGADMHEYAQFALEVFESLAGEDPVPEIDWNDVERVEVLASAGRFIKAIKG